MSERPLAAVWGLGRFGGGLGAANELVRRRYRLRIIDRSARDALSSSLHVLERELADEVEVLPEVEAALDGVSLLCVNPGVRPDHALLQVATERGIQCTQELDLFLESYPGTVIAVTGTNGKSSTTMMLARALEGATGREALAGGNLGGSLFEARHRWATDQFCVLEISSFQASRLELGARPFAALAITNLQADHLDWHGSMASYHRAKLRLLDGVQEGGIALLSEAPGRETRTALAHPRLRVLAPTDAPTMRREGLYLGDKLILDRRRLAVRGDFQLANARLALAITHGLGLDVEAAARDLRGFRGLPHRLARVGTRRGVTFYDNAVSTGEESTRSALESLRRAGPVRWVAGGRSKGGSLGSYATELAPHAQSIHLFGEVAPELDRALRHAGHDAKVHVTLREALDGAFAAAKSGDQLLLSPAFSSFDQYPNFEARARDALAWWHSMRIDSSSDEQAGQPH